MSVTQLEQLKVLAEFADQICAMSENGEDARQRINRLIAKAEDEIKTKSLEIQVQQSHIALLKHLEGFLGRPYDAGGAIRFGETGRGRPRAITGEGK